MPNLLTVDDSTFAGGIGNWTPQRCTLASVATPSSPDGNRTLRLTKSSTIGSMSGFILEGIYSTFVGQHHSLEFDYMVPATNGGIGQVVCRAAIATYALTGAGSVEADLNSAPFSPGAGWLHLAIPDFVVAVPGAVWVGLEIRFTPVLNTTPHRFVTGDLAYIADVALMEGVDVASGGWGVGLVRMGGN